MKYEQRDSIVIASPEGVLSGKRRCDQLEADLMAIVDSGNRALVIDLSGVRYLDALALGVLVKVHDRYQRTGRNIAMWAADKGLRNLFVIAKLIGLFTVHRTEDSALASLAAPQRVAERRTS